MDIDPFFPSLCVTRPKPVNHESWFHDPNVLNVKEDIREDMTSMTF